MGFSEKDYEKTLKLGYSYRKMNKLIGNSIVVNVLEEIFREMFVNKYSLKGYALQHISSQNGVNIRLLTDYYPYALYDYEYEVSGKKYFIIVRYMM